MQLMVLNSKDLLTNDDAQFIRTIESRLNEKKPLIQVLLGPRQVGKTTLIQQLIKKKPSLYHYMSADGIPHYSWVLEQWSYAHEHHKILIIDEIQKIPNWSEAIKLKYDNEKMLSSKRTPCLLLGSSSLSLQTGLSESLTGRFEILKMFHWNYSKSRQLIKLDLNTYLKIGGYPGSYRFLDDSNRWTNYLQSSIVETVISKDILAESKVKNPGLFRQAFYILMSYPAQIISYNKILGQLQDKGNIDLVKHYIKLFEEAYLLKTIPKFSGSELSKKTSSPKIIPLAPSLSCFNSDRTDNPEFKGRIFEALVGAQLIFKFDQLYYWAEGQYEIDYLVKIAGKIILIEVKSGRHKRSKSIEVFLKKYPNTSVIFITTDNYLKFEKNPVDFVNNHL